MANENFKTINTRIALRTGDYAYWTTGAGKDIELIKGEVCVCTVAATDNQATTAPTVLFKVCDTTGKKFADLNWISALAADVYDWAKAANAPNEYDTKYAFEIKDGKLQVTETTYTNGQGGTPKVTSYDFVTPGELTEILKSYYTKTEIDGLIQGVKDIVNGLDESVTTVAKGAGINVTDAGTGNDHAYTVALDVDGAKTALGLKSAAYETVDNLNATAKGYADAVEAKIPTALGVMSVAEGDDTITIGGTAQNPTIKVTANKFDAYGAAAQALADAKDYADKKPHENTEYHVEYDSTNKKIKLVAGADASKMEIDATAFIKDGMIESVELVQEDASGNKGQFLKLTWNDDGKDVTYVPVGELVDVYTGSNGNEVNVAISNTNVVSASLNTAVATKIAHGEEAHGWGNHANQGYAKTADLGALATKNTITHDLVTDFDTEVAKIKVTNAGNADTLGNHNADYFATATSVTDITKDNGTIDSKITAYNASKNFGDIITHNVAEFATKAQGDKADTALQEVKLIAETDAEGNAKHSGLKVNNKNEIAIDDSVVFILDCNW